MVLGKSKFKGVVYFDKDGKKHFMENKASKFESAIAKEIEAYLELKIVCRELSWIRIEISKWEADGFVMKDDLIQEDGNTYWCFMYRNTIV